MSQQALSPKWRRIMALLAVLFGLATVFKGGTVLFGPEAARASVGAFVPFVLWFNFLAGFLYLLAGIGIWAGRRWACAIAGALAIATLLVAGAFAVHIVNGGAYSMQTGGALPLRFGFWAYIAFKLRRGQ